MENLHSLNMEELVDILSTQTALYVKMHGEGASERDFQKCKVLVEAIQEEINCRSKAK